MKKLIVIALSLVLLCGCTAKTETVTEITPKKSVPVIKEASYEDMDIATYKTNWNGEADEERRVLNYSAERYLPESVRAGHSFEFAFSENIPDVVRATEWIINDVETILKDDPEIISTDIEGILSDGKFSFEICNENKSGITIEKRLVVLNCKWESGEEVEYAFLVDVTDGSVNERHMAKAEDIEDLEGFTMTLESDGVFKNYAFADIKNDTDKYAEVSDWYRIDVLEGEDWYMLNYLHSVTAVSWKKEGYGIAEGYGTRLVCEWTTLYGELPEGNYRLVKTVNFDGETESKEFYAEFTVPEIIID